MIIINEIGKPDSKTLRKVLKQMREKLDADKEYKYYVTDHRKPRSLRQNRYLWFIYGFIGNHVGLYPEEVHEICKHLFNFQVCQIGGKIYQYSGTTKVFDTKDMTDYIEKVRQWSLHEFDHYVPEANEIPEEILIDIISREHV